MGRERTAGNGTRTTGHSARTVDEDPSAAATAAEARRKAESDAERRRRRTKFLRELAEAKELMERVSPRRTRNARMRHLMRMRTFRY